MIEAKESFGTSSETYKYWRPSYSAQLFDTIKQHYPDAKTIWDAGTGNGQAAFDLAQSFEQVYATDISQSQINQAKLMSSIVYAVAPAEDSWLKSNSIDLITSAAAVHWFDPEWFIAESQRVSVWDPQFALWSYRASPQTNNDELNQTLDHILCHELLRFWSDWAKHSNNLYKDLPLLQKLHIIESIDFDTIASTSFNYIGIKQYIESLSPSIAYRQKYWKNITHVYSDHINEVMGGNVYDFNRNGRLYLAKL